MIRSALFLLAIVALTGQASTSGGSTRHLVYEFGYNTPVASSGNGTGTMAVDISAAPDGGLTVSGADHWWNTVRPRATNTCEVYANGKVSCSQRPNTISPMQWTLFPMLGKDYFKGLGPQGTWSRNFEMYAAIVPGASGFAGQPYTWKFAYTLVGKGAIPKAEHSFLIETNGTFDQQGGTFRNGKSK
ncbi:MAG: hypothetical protein JO113_03400 [Candidatus Eremiobacteraeota bacterium]|nr:hypothetical protein [Candidatus Eremiobacteraeota bacterium]